MKKITQCLETISSELGLTVGEFKIYSENRLSIEPSKYISVYPQSPDITISDNKMYITNLKVLLAQNLYKGAQMIKMNDKLSII